MSLAYPHCAKCGHEAEAIHIERLHGESRRVRVWCHGEETTVDVSAREIREGVPPLAFEPSPKS